jgi:hypothetical protein
MTREEFITAFEIAFEKLMIPTKGISPSRMEEPMCVESWSLKDLAVHLAHWNTQTIRAIEQLHQGIDFDLSAFQTGDAQDNHDVERARGAPLNRVMTELRLTHSTLTEAVRRVADDRLLPSGEIPVWLVERTVEHYGSHTAQVEAWAQKIKSESLEQK